MQLGLGIKMGGVPNTMASAPAYYTFSLSYSSMSGAPGQRAACANAAPSDTYAAATPLTLGVVLYSDTALTTTALEGVYSDGTSFYEADLNGEIQAYTAANCSAVALSSVLYNFTDADVATACALGAGATPYYVDGGILYTDQWGQSTAPDGYYSDGVDYLQVAGGTGAITQSLTGCPA